MVDVPDHFQVIHIHPLHRRTDAFRSAVGPGEHILDAVLHRVVIESGKDGVVLGHVLIGHLGLEKGQLQILHLVPVHHLGVHVQVQGLHDPLDVLHRHIQVPAGVHRIDQGIETHQLLGYVAQVGAVHAAAHADDAVILTPLGGGLDLLRRAAQQVRVLQFVLPGGLDVLVKIVAEIAHAVLVKGDGAVGGIHHAVGTALVGTVGIVHRKKSFPW